MTRIAGVWLRLRGPSFGWASAQEVRSALGALREAGKPCVAYSETYSTLDYYLASACDHVVMAPSGIGMVLGLSATTTYYKGTLELLGIEPEMEHVGDFKTAVEPFERSEPSDASVEATESLLNSLWSQWVADVSAGRGLEPDQVQALVDAPSLSPTRAMARGLVDALAYPDQLRAHLDRAHEDGWRDLLGQPADDESEPSRVTKLSEYLKDVRRDWGSGTGIVAVLHASGQIVSGEAEGGLFSQQAIADKTFARWMREIRENDGVRALVLRIDSPGGSGLASDMIWRRDPTVPGSQDVPSSFRWPTRRRVAATT